MAPRNGQPRRLRGLVIGCLLAVLSLAIVLGCSDPRQRYRVLSVFFDGVPNPDADALGTRRVGASGRPIYVHQPYAENRCDSCHENTNDIFARAKVRAEVCNDCHADVKTRHAEMHGPVMANACQLCHVAHQSPLPSLLKHAAPKLCTQCHDPGTLQPNPPEHLNPNADCTACHSGHGGSTRDFLKVATMLPATPPTGPTVPAQSGVPR